MRISEEKVWMKYYSPDVQAQDMPRRTIYTHIKEKNANNLDKTAINYYGTKITYAELFDRIEEAARGYTALGVKEGDMVSFLSVAIPECIASVYALNKMGVSVNMIDPRLAPDNILNIIKESGSKITVCLDIAFQKIADNLDELDQDTIVIISVPNSLPAVKRAVMQFKHYSHTKAIPYDFDIIKWKAFIKDGEGKEVIEAPYVGDRTAAIAYTGGTTGFPKGVMLTNDSMNAVAYNFAHAGLEAKAGDRFLGIIPCFTSYGMVCGLHMPLSMQFELIPIPKFVPEKFGNLVKQFRPNHMISTPAFYEMMMSSKALRKMDLSFITTMGSGGDTMNAGLERKLRKFMKKRNIKYPLAQGYGMSEVSAAASFCVNDIYKKGSVGIPSVTTTISVFDPDTGAELGYGETGEICITGPSMMKGYFARRRETKHVMRVHEDGLTWIHSGDLGYMDEDGFLFIIGRVKRMITRFDGHKVFPVTIESIVSAQKYVHNCCVIGVDDRGHGQGQYPLVMVELAEGTDPRIACREIFGICMDQLEERGKPVAVLPVAKIPITGAGKNDYRSLEEEFSGYDYTRWDPMA